MPDPAEIIAETLLRPPVPPVPGDRVTELGLQCQYNSVMGHPGSPGLARRLAEAVVQAFADGGWSFQPPPGPHPFLPSVDQIRAWLARNEWRPGISPGTAGTLWYPPVKGRGVGIPHDGDNPGLTQGAIERIAARMGLSPDQVAAEMMVYTP